MTQSLAEFLVQRRQMTGYSTEDTLASFLPLLGQVIQTHASGFVAPLEGLADLYLEGGRIWFEQGHRRPPREHRSEVQRLQRERQRGALEIVQETQRTTTVDDGSQQLQNLLIGRPGDELKRPVFLPGYIAWEHLAHHHDPLSDVFVLGMILASLACGLDFHESADLERFVAHRTNLFTLQAELHPVLARAILRMTDLDRHRRPQDLPALLQSLENYRYQPLDFELDLARVAGFGDKDLRSKQQVVLSKLQKRLFEISRRNRLLHFRPTLQTVNLTHASVPLCFDVRNIRPDQILVWNRSLQQAVLQGKPVSLNKYLNFAEAVYLPSVLDRIRTEAARDQAEFGFAQLRLVICFLNWANLKEDPPERFQSPLILLPVKLFKKKGIRDTFWLDVLSSEAEVNPVVRHQFKVLYGIDLPETIELDAGGLESFFDYLHAKIRESGTGVSLNKIDRPRIDLIHEKAKRRLDQYRRRARIAGRGVRTYRDLDYSYDPVNYHPLGLKLFSTLIRPTATRLRAMVEQSPRPRSYAAQPSQEEVVEKRQSFVSLRDSESENPYIWDFDLCSVTLGNFKYRKMSLVRDYVALLDEPISNAAFDATFSLVPRPQREEQRQAVPLADRFHVVPCDPTQDEAIAQARAGQSYIIQGPPGTGKSQTITNLIADYVARGKRVLFVCEKRAAIDVVYRRLKQQGLAELCCLIHDSQTDKKAFVLDLKNSYEAFLDHAHQADDPRLDRSSQLARLNDHLQPLQHFDTRMCEAPPAAGMPLRKLLERAIQLRSRQVQLTPLQQELLPDYAEWIEQRERIERFATHLQDIQPDGVFAHHRLRLLSIRLAADDRPLQRILSTLEQAQGQLDQLEHALRASHIARIHWDQLEQAQALIDYARQVAPLARWQQFALLDADSPQSAVLQRQEKTLSRDEQAVKQASQAARYWRRRLPAEETRLALAQAQELEKRRLPWLRPAWWRLRRLLRRSYQFSAHAVRPSGTQILHWLDQEHAAHEQLRRDKAQLCDELEFEGDVDLLLTTVKRLRQQQQKWSDSVRQVHRGLVRDPQVQHVMGQLESAGAALENLLQLLDDILDDVGDRALSQLRQDFQAIQDALDQLPDFLYCLSEMASLPPRLVMALRTLPLNVEQLEAAIAAGTLAQRFRADRELARFNAKVRSRHVRRLEQAYLQWQKSNATEVRERARRSFLKHVQLATQPSAQLEAEEKEFKKTYNRGRRELEHEFGKVMRYKSIRDLVAGESGTVVRDLKPVWLMSPLSVSDTLPLDTDSFDVVIFDEASQIPLEEAIPSIFRARQAIVVGDQMQLPPTNFFSARRAEEDEELWIEDDGELVEYELDSDSFLNHAARNLPSKMLGWHYRSRSESLISFSNWAFYHGRLLTVPEEQLPAQNQSPLFVRQAQDADRYAGELMRRPISFHFMEHGVYHKRRNRAEADYIARLVRLLLVQQVPVSLGVVAFSEAQQTEIEEALQRLAQQDADFSDRLEAELEREEDGQFVGLLVKNLENIQGDERDVIILSVCYGQGPDGKMLMNFGPINKSGGEKRLNVAFSRAKHHMALVSSIQHTHITNDYNDGANCLKSYLRYAAAISLGKTDASQRVLREMALWRDVAGQPPQAPRHTVSHQLADALRHHGYLVDFGVGQSHFRCDLAIRRETDPSYRLAVLIDDDDYYQQRDLLERELMRPRLLRTFGWRVTHVFHKEWHQAPDTVLQRLLGLLQNAQPASQDDQQTKPPSNAAEEQPPEGSRG